MRVLHRKTYKMTVMTSSNKNLKKWKKCHLKFLWRSLECIFIKIGRKLWKIFIWTDRQTDTHTHRRTDRYRPGTTYSVLKWLNIKKLRPQYLSRNSGLYSEWAFPSSCYIILLKDLQLLILWVFVKWNICFLRFFLNTQSINPQALVL